MRWWWQKKRDLTTRRLIRADGDVIDISPLREKLGAAWSQYGPAIHRIASRIISQEIAGAGTFSRHAESYELTFSNLSRRRARRECARIAGKLDETLGGSPREHSTPQQPLGIPAAAGQPAPLAIPVPAPAPDVPPEWNRVAPAAPAVVPDMPPPAESTRTSRAMERAAAQLARQKELANGAILIFPPPDLRADFRPFWEIKSKHVTMYGITPTSTWGGHRHAGYMSILPRNFGATETLALDQILLTESVAALAASSRPEHRALAITSLHAMTLEDDAASAAFLDACKGIPERLRARLLFEIIDIHRLTGSAESYGKILRLSKFGRGMLGRLSVRATNLAFCKTLGLLAVGFDLADDVRPEGNLLSDVETFAVIASRSKLESYARGLDSVSLTIAALGAGIGYIEGTFNQQDQNGGLSVLPFQIQDLYGLPAAS
jgi:hypothetical protein